MFHLGVDSSITTAQNDTLEEEIKINGDILKQNFVDNYQNLTSNISLNFSMIDIYIQSRVSSCSIGLTTISIQRIQIHPTY